MTLDPDSDSTPLLLPYRNFCGTDNVRVYVGGNADGAVWFGLRGGYRCLATSYQHSATSCRTNCRPA
eukprot:3937999-Rhodomonas_salina.1